MHDPDHVEGQVQRPSDRVLTIPNVLSRPRLLGVPVFLWLVLNEHDGCGVVLMVSGVHRLARRQDRAALEPDLAARPAARPGRRPALHPRHAHRAHGPRHRAAVADARPGRPRRPARVSRCRCCAGTATARCPCTSSARRRPSTCCPASRCCCSVSGDVAGEPGGARVRLGVRDLGYRAVLVGRRALRRPGARLRCVPAGRTSTRGACRHEGRRDGRRRGHPPAPDDREHAQAAAARRQQADHGARPAAARSGTASPRPWSPSSSSPAWCATTSATARSWAWRCTTPPRTTPLGTAGSVKNAEAPAARRHVPGHLRRRAHRLRPHRPGEVPPRQGRARHGLPDPGARPARVRHHDHRRRRTGCSASSRSRPGARCSPTPSTPAST